MAKAKPKRKDVIARELVPEIIKWLKAHDDMSLASWEGELIADIASEVLPIKVKYDFDGWFTMTAKKFPWDPRTFGFERDCSKILAKIASRPRVPKNK